MSEQRRANRRKQEAEARPQAAAVEDVVFLSWGSLSVTTESLTRWGPFPEPVRSSEGSVPRVFTWTGQGCSGTANWQGGVLGGPPAAEGPR